MQLRWPDLRVRPRTDDGFTIIEALVAVTILSVAIVLSIQPVMSALRGVSDARIIGVAENLAQGEIEVLRSLDYEQIGLPGRTPEGTLTGSREITVEGRRYVLDLDIQYAGSLTGLDIIPQGGDGVQGSWDPGVDYKVATVTVTASGRESDPIIMQTIIAPTRVGQHEGIANARVILDAHEPFATSGLPLPILEIHDPPNPPINSGIAASEQVFPAIPSGDYTVLVHTANGWIIHPEDVISGLDQLSVVPATTAETTLRVFRPATLELEVFDADTSADVTDATLTLTDTVSGVSTAYGVGDYTVTSLMPDTYDVLVTAPGYSDWSMTSVNIPAAYPNPLHQLTVYLTPLAPTSTTTTTTTGGTGSSSTTSSSTTTTTTPGGGRIPVEFVVVDNRNMVIAGAQVSVTHSSDGPFSGVTGPSGTITFNLLDGEQYTAVGSTSWGHSSDSDPVNVGGWIDALELGRPGGRGLMTLYGGTDGDLLYRRDKNDPWVAMPANLDGAASFVGSDDGYRVAKRCLANGEVVGETKVKVKKNTNRSETIFGYCPPS